MNLKKKWLMTVPMLACAVAMVACGKKPSGQKEAAPAAEEQKAAAPAAAPAAAGVGTIKGSVKFTGTAPTMPDLNRQSDPFCAQTQMKAQNVVVNANNTLANVAVRVLNASGGTPNGATVEIDQKNCMYAPRVITATFGEEVKIVNSDPTLHNVHTYNNSDNKTLFNRAQPKGSPAINHTFKPEDGEIVKFKCDVHPWMTGWLINTENGLASVTGETGEFEIKNVPAGTYTLKTFQEDYGEKEVQVTVEADKTAQVELSYDGTEKAAYQYREINIGMADHNHSH